VAEACPLALEGVFDFWRRYSESRGVGTAPSRGNERILMANDQTGVPLLLAMSDMVDQDRGSIGIWELVIGTGEYTITTVNDLG